MISLVESALAKREPEWRARDLDLEQAQTRRNQTACRDGRANGRHPKLTEKQAEEVRRLISRGMSQTQVAGVFRVDRSTIGNVVRGEHAMRGPYRTRRAR